jgi:hypothetical protein
MSAPKAKTFLEKLGFRDDDLTKPLHDDMLKWVNRNIEDILMLTLTLQGRPKVKSIDLELPVLTREAHDAPIMGYVDAAVWTERDLDDPEGFRKKPVIIEAKSEIKSVGELLRQIRTYERGFIRGIQLHQCHFIVVCPDDSNAEWVKEQGFHFLKYDPQHAFDSLGGVK